jgi:hypothetical protein
MEPVKARAVSIWAVLQAQLRASPRKAAVLGVLSLVLLVLVLRLFARGPQVAEAEPVPAAGQLIPPAALPLPDLAMGNAALPKPRFPSQPARDPFSVERNLFEPIPGHEIRPKEQAPVTNADPLLEVVSRLHLQSTVTGPSPLATVNGMVLRVGDSIEGLKVKSIGSRNIELAYGDRVFELWMK